MIELLDLKEIGSRLRKVDQHLVALLAQRMKLSLQVEEWKNKHRQAIIRPEIEDQRLADVREWAKERGINPNFAYSILYFIMKESCSVQIEQMQNPERENEPDQGCSLQIKSSII